MAGITADRLHTIFLTHFHADHIADILPFMLARYLTLKEENTELQIFGPVGLKGWFRHLSLVAGGWIGDLSIRLTEVRRSFVTDGYRVSAALTGHTENSLCYRITGPDKKVLFYSGDTDYHDSLAETAARADLCILEASNTGDTKVEGHMTPVLAGKLAQEAGVRHLLLTHMYPEVLAVDAVSQAAGHFTGKISLARDGTNVKF
jgi:ribonuclease BN (tRNA processing enzyme)